MPDDAVIKEKCWHAFDPNSKIKYCLTNIRRGIELTQTEIAFIKRSFSVAAEMAILHKDTESLSAIFAMKKKVDLDLIDSLLEKNNDSQEARAFILDYKNKYYSNENISQHFDEKQEKEFDPSKRTISDWRKIYKFPISPNDGKVTIDGYKGNEKTVIIPGEIGKYSVISVSKKAFKDQKEITEVIIGEGIKEIGSETFFHCISLEKITLPNSLSEINSSAFEGCISLTEISIPGNVKVISGWAFRSCIELKKVMICEGVSEISSCAFQGCKELETIYIPNSVTNIEIYPFMDCKKLTIHAPAGSYAETYAKENNIPFIAE